MTIYLITKNLGFDFRQMFNTIWEGEHSKMIFGDWHDKRFYLKQLLSGAFIAIVMTGLDQEMMQKNLSCRTLKDAQKNMFSFSIVLVLVNFLFLFLGAALYLFVSRQGINLPERSDDLFPLIAINYLGPVAGLVFIIGLISAAYPSADGALTSLTTSFSIDFLGLNKNEKLNEKQKEKTRYLVHASFALLLLVVIVIFRAINDRAVVDKLFTIAGYTYGPLLGLFAFGLFTKWQVKDKWVPLIAVISPIMCYYLSVYDQVLLNNYNFGFELLIINGIFTFLGLVFIRKQKQRSTNL
jgi:SSS family solute:Na+ symporter